MIPFELLIPDLGTYEEVRFDPNAIRPRYIGFNKRLGTSTKSADWTILKINYYFRTPNIQSLQKKVDVYDNREKIFPALAKALRNR